MMALWVFVAFLSLGTSLTLRQANFTGLPPPFAGTLNVPTATYEWQAQWQNTKPSSYGRNYTVLIPPDIFGCVNLPPSYAGVASISIMGANTHCQYSDMSNAAAAGGAVAVIGVIPFPISFAMIHESRLPIPGNPAVVTWGNIGDTLPVAQQVPMSIVMIQALFNGPIVVTLDFPVQNPTYTNFITVPSLYGWIYYMSLTLALIGLTFVQCKLYVFLLKGLIKSIATITLAISWFGSGWLVFICFQGFGMTVPASPADFHVVAFFELWPFAFAASALVFMGFYFTEIATLTSSKKVEVLDRMIIPGVVAVACVWIITIIASFFAAVYTSQNPLATNGDEKYAVAAVYGLIGLFVLFIVFFGSISLFVRVNSTRQTLGNSDQFWTVVRFLSLAIFASLNYVWGIILYICCRYFFVETVANSYNEIQVQMLFKVGIAWGPALVFISISGIFRVGTQKEIEMSKAGLTKDSTSSTSGVSSASGSSSSASAHDVVEL